MRVYLAADSSLQQRMRELRARLEVRGITVTSRWLDVDLIANKGRAYTDEELSEWAFKDLADIDNAQVFICFNPVSKQKQGTGGRHVEFGYAHARGKMIIYCGEKKENIFHYLSSVKATIYSEDLDMESLVMTLISTIENLMMGFVLRESER